MLTYRNLDAGGGASYRTIYIAKYLSNFFRVFIVDGQRNTYIIVDRERTMRKKQKRSILNVLLSYIPLILSRTLSLLKFPSEEVGRITSTFDLGIFYDALRISLRIKPFIIIVEEYYSLMGIAFFLKKFFKVKHLVLDLHNIDALRLLRYPNANKTFVKLIYLLEKRMSNFADWVIVVSNRDLYLARKFFNIDRITIVPNFVPYKELEHVKHEDLGDMKKIMPDNYIVFHGDFRYYPNREALSILIKHIMPRIWKLYPTVKLVVVGPGLPRVSKGRVLLMGYVSQETLYKILRNACCAIVPLLRGGGTRIKILEYMANGVPVISTKIGAEGLEVENFKHIILANSVDDIPLMFRVLMENDELREKIRHNAITLIKETYDIAKAMREFISICLR